MNHSCSSALMGVFFDGANPYATNDISPKSQLFSENSIETRSLDAFSSYPESSLKSSCYTY